jgi:hypothetical protein
MSTLFLGLYNSFYGSLLLNYDILIYKTMDTSRESPAARSEAMISSQNDEGDIMFVHVSKPGVRSPRTQTRVRQHIMRDIGLSRRRKKRQVTVSLKIPTGSLDDDVDRPLESISQPPRHSDAYIPYPQPFIPPTGLYPVQVDARDRQLMHFSTLLLSLPRQVIL